MNSQMIKIVIIVVPMLLLIYGVYVFLIPFWNESNEKEKVRNYEAKGFLYALAVITSLGAYLTGEKVNINSIVLIFISAIEVISCFKMRKSLLNKLSTHKKQGTSGHLQWLLIAIIGICVIIVIPCLVATLTKFVGANSTWIDFWGGYLGAILGGLITLFVLWKTLKEEKVARDREEKINYFNDIIHMWSELVRTLNDMCLYIYRCEAEFDKDRNKKNDNIEKVYMQKANLTSLATEITLLLATRNSLYNIDAALKNVNDICKKADEVATLFIEAKKLGFEDVESCNSLEEKILELKEDAERITEQMENTVAENLL